MLSAKQMQALPEFFADIPDPRRAQGRRHRLPTVLAIAAGATLCGMCGYLGISDWAKSLGQKAHILCGRPHKMWESCLSGSMRGWRATLVWMKYSGTAGKPGGKQRTQSSSYSQGSLQPTRT
jgi:hypothetical protein